MTQRLQRNRLLNNRKGYSGIIAAIFMVLIALYLFFNVFMFVLDRDTAFKDTSSQVTQMDIDRNTEQISVYGLNYNASGNRATVYFTINNVCPLSIEIMSVWIKDITLSSNQINYGCNSASPFVLQPGQRKMFTQGISVTINGASPSDSFISWFVTARGRSISTITTMAYVPGVLAGFVFNTIGNQRVGVAFRINITAVDAYGTTITNYTGTNTLSLSAGTITPTSTGAFVNGVWTGNVTINQAVNGVVIFTYGAGCSGMSNPFNVVSSGVPFGLDGSNSTTSQPPSTSLSLTVNTTYAGDLIYVVVAEHSVTVSGISSNLGLTFTNRINVAISSGDNMQIFYTVKPPSGPVIITISFTGNGGFCSVVAFGISGANTASPFDVSSPPYSIATNTHALVTLNTNIPSTSANDFVIGAVGVASSNPILTKGAAFTLIANPSVSNIETSAEYEIVPAPQTNLTVDYTLGSAQTWAMVADAVKQG